MTVLTFLLPTVVAVIPAIALLALFYRLDRYPEPRQVVFVTFGLGVLSTLFLELVKSAAYVPLMDAGIHPHRFFSVPIVDAALTAFVEAALLEELLKLAVLLLYAARQRVFDEPMDGMVYGAAASLGYAMAENLDYVLMGGYYAALVRALCAVPMHAGVGAIMGYFIGQWRFGPPPRRRLHLAAALVWPILLHGSYDFPIFWFHNWNQMTVDAEATPILTPLFWAETAALSLVVAVIVLWVRRLVRRLREQQRLSGAAGYDGAIDRGGRPPLKRWLGRLLLALGILLLASAIGLVGFAIYVDVTAHFHSDLVPEFQELVVRKLYSTALVCGVSAIAILAMGSHRLGRRARAEADESQLA